MYCTGHAKVYPTGKYMRSENGILCPRNEIRVHLVLGLSVCLWLMQKTLTLAITLTRLR